MSASEYDFLPEDDDLAFLALEGEFRRELHSKLTSTDSRQNRVARIDYMNKTIGAARALSIKDLIEYSVPTVDSGKADYVLENFTNDLEKILIDIKVRKGRRNRRYSAHLTSDQKQKIHTYIGLIRESIEESAVSDDKKDRIFSILSTLSTEIDKNRTRLEIVGDVARSIAGISYEVERDGARPWYKYLLLLLGVVDEAKEKEPQLPAPERPKQLEPPRKELPPPNSGTVDDEFPF